MIGQIRHLAEQTPPERERHVDLVRAFSIVMVVVGHWIVMAITDTDDGLDGINALREVTWFHPLTWLFQVVPLFFFVGGYANVVSLRSHHRSGGDRPGWIVKRFDRLTRPVTVFLATLVAGALSARALGVELEVIATAAWLLTVPLWFLLAYLAVTALVPWTVPLHERHGLKVAATLGVWVIANDVAGSVLDVPYVHELNYLLVFMVIHQLGFAWRDGALRATPQTGIPLTVLALTALIALVATGVYPVSMVTVPGQEMQNTEPPTFALLVLGLAQIGVALATRNWFTARLRRRRPWMAVVALNAVILTMFIWHLSAALIAALLLYGTGLLPTVAVGSETWLLLRIPWLAACFAVLAALTAVFWRFERAAPGVASGTQVPHRLAQMLVTGSVGLLLAGLVGIALAGSDVSGTLGLPTWVFVCYGVGAAALALAVRRAEPPA